MITDDKTCSCTSFPMVTKTSLRQCGIVFFICKIDENLKSQIIVSAFSTTFLLENNPRKINLSNDIIIQGLNFVKRFG